MPQNLAKTSDDFKAKMLTPRFRKRFFQGYDPAEVDVLIDNWLKKISDLTEQNIQQSMKLQEASNYVKELEAQRAEETHGIALVMTTAENTAKQIVSDATTKAANLERVAGTTLSTAKFQAKQILESAESEAITLRAELNKEVEQAHTRLYNEAAMVQGAIGKKISAANETFTQLAVLSDQMKNYANQALGDISYVMTDGDQMTEITSILQLKHEVVTVTRTDVKKITT